MTESEVEYVRGQVSEILISKEDFKVLTEKHSIKIDGIRIKVENGEQT